MKTTITIRRNSVKRIAELLAQAAAISGSYNDDQIGSVFYTMTPAEIVYQLKSFERVSAVQDAEGRVLQINFVRYRGHCITAWLDVDHAFESMTAPGFIRVFPSDPRSEALLEHEIARRVEIRAARERAEKSEEWRLTNLPEPESYEAGSRFIARFATTTDLPTADQYREECVRPAESGRWADELCEVQEVIHMNRLDFSHFCANLTDATMWLGRNGRDSDYLLPHRVAPEDLAPAERQRYDEQSYRLVTVVTCDGCRPLIIDADGHMHARSVGLWPRQIHQPRSQGNILVFPLLRTMH